MLVSYRCLTRDRIDSNSPPCWLRKSGRGGGGDGSRVYKTSARKYCENEWKLSSSRKLVIQFIGASIVSVVCLIVLLRVSTHSCETLILMRASTFSEPKPPCNKLYLAVLQGNKQPAKFMSNKNNKHMERP